jgi:hypothetical protein
VGDRRAGVARQPEVSGGGGSFIGFAARAQSAGETR